MNGWVALGANALILGFLAVVTWLRVTDPAGFYNAVQEDSALEWASFWGFAMASVVFAGAAREYRRATRHLPWFLAGVAMFCFLVAMEEISWGQRVFGLQPAEYFLEENYQQEINLHNIASTRLRLFVFRAIVLGYGVLLPLLAIPRRVEGTLERIGVIAPPIELSPSMFALFWLHLHYPWKFTGEIVECGLGAAFLFAGLAAASQFRVARGLAPRSAWTFVGLPAAVVGLGFVTAAWSQARAPADPRSLQWARAETAALSEDVRTFFEARGAEDSSCGFHKRVFTFVQDRPEAASLRNGAFAARVELGLDATRAQFFLDPWGTSYWVRERCDEAGGRRVAFVYSFGPNRKRDSSRWEILGDDIGEYVLDQRGSTPR